MLHQLKVFKIFLSMFLSITLLAGCSADKVDKAGSSSLATFFVDSVDGTSEVAKRDETYLIPKERLYNFKVCLKDIMQSKAILGQSFKISGGDLEKTVNSDEQGCLNWSESIAFNFLAPSNYIEVSRTIVANGVHKGSTNIKLVVNPWSHGDETTGVIDPTKKTVTSLIDQSKATSALMAEGTSSPLWAIAPRVTIVDKEFTSSGANMSLKFQTKLSLILKSTTLQNFQYPISNGNFNVEMILYNSFIENNKETFVKLANSTQYNVAFTQDTLIAEFPFSLNMLPKKGQIFLGIKIIAPDNQIGLDPFEGIYTISNNANIKIDTSPIPAKDQKFSDIKKQIINDEKIANAETNKSISAKPGIEVDKLEIRFFKIGNESTSDRQVFFNVKACMKSNLDGRLIRDEEFKIKTVSSKNLVKLKTNQDGCLSWDDSIWHKFFGAAHFIKSTVNVTNENYNLNIAIPVILNPWETGLNFARDGRFVDDLGSLAVTPSSESAKIVIDSYVFSVSKYAYSINDNLDLTMSKKGVLTLNAKVLNYSSATYGRMGYDELRDGKYLLKWAIVTVDENNKADTVVSSGDQLVNSFGGDVKTNIEFKISAFEKLNIRSRLTVALYTVKDKADKKGSIVIDKSSGLEATPFIGTIVLNNDQENQKMQRLDNNFGLGNGDVFDRLATLSTTATSKNAATAKVIGNQNLKKINLSNEKESLFLRDGLANPTKYHIQNQNPSYFHEAEQKPALRSEVLVNFAKTGKLSAELAESLCSFWFKDYLERLRPNSKISAIATNSIQSLTMSCINNVKKNPTSFFSIDKKLLVKKVGESKYVRGATTNFSVGNSFSISKSDSKSKTTAWAWSASAGLSLEFFDIFKVGTNSSYSVTSSRSKTDVINNSSQVGAATYLFLQANTYNIELTSYEECSSIRLNPELFASNSSNFRNIWSDTMKPNEIATVATSGFFLCTGVNNNTPITKTENYYLVAQDSSGNRGQQDGFAEENHQFFMTFRGQRDLAAFLNLIQSSVKLPGSVNSFEENSVGTKSALGQALNSLPTWPGAYTDIAI